MKDELLYSMEAEESVLGSLLLNWSELEVVAKVFAALKSDHFYREKNAWVYTACSTLHRQSIPIDEVTVAYELASKRKLEAIGGAAYLPYLVGHICTPLHLEYHARIIIELYQKRLKEL